MEVYILLHSLCFSVHRSSFYGKNDYLLNAYLGKAFADKTSEEFRRVPKIFEVGHISNMSRKEIHQFWEKIGEKAEKTADFFTSTMDLC